MRISDWSSDVCSSDLIILARQRPIEIALLARQAELGERRKDTGGQAGTQLRAEETPILRLAGVAGAGSKLHRFERTGIKLHQAPTGLHIVFDAVVPCTRQRPCAPQTENPAHAPTITQHQ